MKLIFVEVSFQPLGLDFIDEINPTSSGQHRWILTTTYYFTKWIEVVPARQKIDTVIITFLEENILSRFGFSRRIITNNAQEFKSKKMVKFCEDYNIIFSHSILYYWQGNGLVESSNKSFIRMIKKLLEENKKVWHLKLKYDLWESRISTKISIGTSPLQLVYGTEVIFPTSLGILVMKFLQDQEEDPNPLQNISNHLIEIQCYEPNTKIAQKIKNKYSMT